MSSKLPTEMIDAPLGVLGFEFEEVSAVRVSGCLLLTEKCCQPFKVLHGGVSALIAEGLASVGAAVACGYKRIAGIHLSIHHLRPASLGDSIYAEAFPISTGKNIQVWEVRLWKTEKTGKPDKNIVVSTSQVTLFCGLPLPDHAKDFPAIINEFMSKL